MGLDVAHDRLCVVHLSQGDGSADVLQIPPPGCHGLRSGRGRIAANN
jgi:hypothetical protein